MINVSELTVITRVTSVQRTAGASLFAVDVQVLTFLYYCKNFNVLMHLSIRD